MASSNQQNLLSSNADYASKFTQGSLALPPAKKYAVVTCMDARIDPVGAFVSSSAREGKLDLHAMDHTGQRKITAARASLLATHISSEMQAAPPSRRSVA